MIVLATLIAIIAFEVWDRWRRSKPPKELMRIDDE
jgi:hypothetical protein